MSGIIDEPCSLPIFDPSLANDGDTLYIVLCQDKQTTSGFETDLNTEEARTGIEHLGVQFVDLSFAGGVDGTFVLDNGSTVFDETFEFEV